MLHLFLHFSCIFPSWMFSLLCTRSCWQRRKNTKTLIPPTSPEIEEAPEFPQSEELAGSASSPVLSTNERSPPASPTSAESPGVGSVGERSLGAAASGGRWRRPTLPEVAMVQEDFPPQLKPLTIQRTCRVHVLVDSFSWRFLSQMHFTSFAGFRTFTQLWEEQTYRAGALRLHSIWEARAFVTVCFRNTSASNLVVLFPHQKVFVE